MCGIAGIFMRNGASANAEALARMAKALHLRGPDSTGTHIAGPIGILSTRLAIVDVAHGQQPFTGPGGAVLVANGEIYNSPELRAEFPDAPYQTGSDSETALHVFERLGLDYVTRLRGMYAIAVHDAANDRLVLSRDEFGIKPLCFAQTDDFIIFASEPQAIIASGLVTAVEAPDARNEMLQLKYISGARTMFAGVERVLPGETLVIQHGRIALRTRLESLPSPAKRRLSRDAELVGIEAALLDSIAVHLRADDPCSLFLSSGVDSSLLAVLMQSLSEKPIAALTVGYAGAHANDESWDALRTADALGAQCERIEMGEEDFWRLAPRIAAAIDDATADTAVLPTYLLGKIARDRGFKVALCGEGADELFGGYARYRRASLPWARAKNPGERRGVFADEETQRRLAGWDRAIADAEAREEARAPSRLEAVQALDWREWMVNDLLVKLDRCLMAHSVEGRTPYIDRTVVAFARGLPDAYKADWRMGKILLRALLARHLPQARPFAKKKGFNAPVGAWMARRGGDLSRLVSAQPGVRAVFTPDIVHAAFADAQANAQRAWSLLYYALWHSRHMLGAPAEGDIAEVLGEAARANARELEPA